MTDATMIEATTREQLPVIARAFGSDPELIVMLCELIPQESQVAVLLTFLSWFEQAGVGPTRIPLMQLVDYHFPSDDGAVDHHDEWLVEDF